MVILGGLIDDPVKSYDMFKLTSFQTLTDSCLGQGWRRDLRVAPLNYQQQDQAKGCICEPFYSCLQSCSKRGIDQQWVYGKILSTFWGQLYSYKPKILVEWYLVLNAYVK